MLHKNLSKTDNLYHTILTLKTLDEAKKFFRDLLTEKEITELSNRWETVIMLDKHIPYSTIEKKTGLSSTTIARISKWLENGKGGYKLALKKLK